jgi:hypothetical protein
MGFIALQQLCLVCPGVLESRAPCNLSCQIVTRLPLPAKRV